MVLTAARELDDDEVDDSLLRCIRRTYVHTSQCYIIYMPPYNYYIYAYNGCSGGGGKKRKKKRHERAFRKSKIHTTAFIYTNTNTNTTAIILYVLLATTTTTTTIKTACPSIHHVIHILRISK